MLIIGNSPYMDIKQSPRCIGIRLSIVIEFDLIQIMIENPIQCQSWNLDFQPGQAIPGIMSIFAP